ncbi:MAG: ATP-dependent RecD-like DNA helicase [Clostridia bacterium]|nr:ATP-dependent RecD-like DNA helicase [Clostridia bacterium]
MPDNLIINGYIEDVVYCNQDNGYSVFKINHENNLVTCVGIIPGVRPGELVELSGNWVTHNRFGRQFGFNHATRQLPDNEDAIVKFLASGFVKGIGEKTALKIVQHFGSETSSVLENEPIRLAEIHGISEEKALQAGALIKEQKSLAANVLFFSKYGLNSNYAIKAYKYLGEESLELIKKNPYLLCDDMVGLSFKQADRIAAGEEMEETSPFRIASGIIYVLNRASQAGNTYLPYDSLVEYCCQILRVDKNLVEDEILQSITNGVLIDEKGKIYLTKFYYAEEYVADRTKSLTKLTNMNNQKMVDETFSKVLGKLDIELDETQKSAVNMALYHGISIISGGPGTGKTTIIKVLIDTFFLMGLKFFLAAPTGRASKKMEEYSVFKAKTIHRLLEVDVISDHSENTFLRNEHNPLECDVLIIDESSMVDILLMQSLLKALPPGGMIVLIGDINQLPAVGPGLVLKDLISSRSVEFSILDKIYRQEEFSNIPKFASDIINGIISDEYFDNQEIHLTECKNEHESLSEIEKIYKQKIASGVDVQLISPSKKGILGTINLNKYMQQTFNPQKSDVNEKHFNTRIFRENDKVMQIRNNYDLYYVSKEEEGFGVYNGDIGCIKTIDNDNGFLTVIYEGGREVKYEFNELDQIELSYCITVHKSQGSEYDCIILPLYNAYDALLNRNLLYTAVTRAKKNVYLVGDKGILSKMINNKDTSQRYSGLEDMLKK